MTLSDDSERDCLQKIYPVGRFMAMGFAGSVLIGFEMIDRLTQLLQRDDPDSAWEPNAVAEWWPEDAREVFHSFDTVDTERGCELLLLSAHPSENAGDVPWARCFVHRFRAPDFIPELAGPWEVLSIGCGAGVDLYRQALDDAATNFMDLQMEVGNPGGTAFGLMMRVRAAVEENPVPGISPHVQICVVRRGNIDIHHFNRRSFGGTGRDLVMPRLARNAREFCELLGEDGQATAGARC